MKIDLSNILKEHFSEVFFDRDEFLLRAGDKEEYLYYLDTGIVRLFYDDSKTDIGGYVFQWNSLYYVRFVFQKIFVFFLGR